MKKKILILTTLILCIIGATPTYAISKSDINNVTLDEMSYRKEYDVKFSQYLEKNSIKKEAYETVINLTKNGRLKIMDWYDIESGLIFYDELLFSHPKISAVYEEIKKENPQNSIEKNRQLVKKEIITSLDSIEMILKESLNKYSNHSTLFKKIFKRNPNEKELNWMNDIKTLKYAAYSGKLNKELTEEDLDKINNSKGYELMNYEFEDYDELMILLYAESLLENHEIKYHKTYGEYEVIQNIIIENFQLDIYSELKEEERLNIYMKSTQNMRLNKTKLLTYTLELLKEKGLISSNDKEPTLPENQKPESEENPYEGRIEYIKKNTLWNKLQEDLLLKYSDMFKKILLTQYGQYEVCLKYDDKIYNTMLYVNKEEELYDIQEYISLKINELLGGKIVKSKEKTMILLQENITVYENYKNEKDKSGCLNYLNNKFKDLGLEIVLKEKK